MTADILNLRRARKSKARAIHSAEADANRAKHGRSRPERETAAREAEIAARRLDGHQLIDVEGAGDGVGA